MNHRSGIDRSQTLLFPESLDDYVCANNPVPFLDAFVASLDLLALGFNPKSNFWMKWSATEHPHQNL